MTSTVTIVAVDDLTVEVVRKDIANLYIRVHPPDGRVRVSVPRRFDDGQVRRAVTDRREWILRHRERILTANPDVSATLVSGDVLHLWGVPHRLEVVVTEGRPGIALDGGRIVLSAPDGAMEAERRAIVEGWYRDRLRSALPDLITSWESRMGVTVPRVTVRRMTTRWGSCNTRTRHITLNLDLATKDPALLEYVVVHEMTHYFEPGHGRRFQALMDRFLPDWRERRTLLNGG